MWHLHLAIILITKFCKWTKLKIDFDIYQFWKLACMTSLAPLWCRKSCTRRLGMYQKHYSCVQYHTRSLNGIQRAETRATGEFMSALARAARSKFRTFPRPKAFKFPAHSPWYVIEAARMVLHTTVLLLVYAKASCVTFSASQWRQRSHTSKFSKQSKFQNRVSALSICKILSMRLLRSVDATDMHKKFTILFPMM